MITDSSLPSQPGKDQFKKLALSLLEYIKPYKARLLQAAATMTLLAVIRGIIVLVLGPVVKGVFVDKDLNVLHMVVIGLPLLFVVRMAAEYANSYLMSWVGQKAVQKIREDLFTHIHNLSIEFHWRKRSSEIMSRVINDLNNVQSTVQFIPLYGIRDVLTVISCITVLFYLHWKLALASLIILPCTAVILRILGRKMRKSGSESNAIVGEISHKFQESLQGITVVKAFNYEEQAIAKFKLSNDDYFSKMMRYLRASSISGPIMEFLGSMVLVGIIYLGGQAIFRGTMTIEHFFSFVGGFFTAYMPLKNIANMNSRLQLGMASWERIHQILEETPAVVVKKETKNMERVEGKIEFKGVNYKYPSRDMQVLKDLSFTIEPGQVAAFVGPSGSGKTTIVHLLLRFFDPLSGSVEVDGHGLLDLGTTDLRSHMGLVTQDTILFDDTVFKNVTIGRPGASLEEVIDATKAADAHAFISAMPQGYETVLGERGVKLSGGQRQRLAIARAIIKKPKILLLDEATSNLDTASEQAVQAAIERILGGRTVVMVAHRLSTVRNADKIFVLRKGELAETGTHEELLRLGGVYKGLYAAQT
ncbi:MAG: ABC transporter permease [Elusimicrobia bacterium CG08_land_8_20_14_0_20_59_10]|nr:MAG: ABC transporter permease [Elusimicrobia bacterium CG08_land_8_20_14_0_20_59_10]